MHWSFKCFDAWVHSPTVIEGNMLTRGLDVSSVKFPVSGRMNALCIVAGGHLLMTGPARTRQSTKPTKQKSHRTEELLSRPMPAVKKSFE